MPQMQLMQLMQQTISESNDPPRIGTSAHRHIGTWQYQSINERQTGR
jgi:hypothetical protein